MSTTKVILHIGFPKTGTTTLQNSLFYPLHKQDKILYHGRSNNPDFFGVFESRLEFNQTFLVPQPRKTTFDQSKTASLKDLINKDRINVISDENFTFPNSFLYNSVEMKYNRFFLLEKLIEELKSIENVELVVVLTLRNQADLLRSLFIHWYSFFLTKFSQKDLVASQFVLNKLQSEELINELNFGKWIDHLNQILGAHKLKVLFFEDLKHDLKGFSNVFDDLLNLDVGETFDLLQNALHNVKKVNSDGTETRSFKKINSNLQVLSKSPLFKLLKSLVPSEIKNKLAKEEKVLVPFWSDPYMQEIMKIMHNQELIELGFIDKDKLQQYCYVQF